MSKADDLMYVEHIVSCIADVERYVGGRRSFFMEDDMARNATLRQLQIMSESCMRLSKMLRDNIPGIDWRQIAGFRNILVHDYTGELDFDLTWDVIQNDLPKLKAAMLLILETKGTSS